MMFWLNLLWSYQSLSLLYLKKLGAAMRVSIREDRTLIVLIWVINTDSIWAFQAKTVMWNGELIFGMDIKPKEGSHFINKCYVQDKKANKYGISAKLNITFSMYLIRNRFTIYKSLKAYFLISYFIFHISYKNQIVIFLSCT